MPEILTEVLDAAGVCRNFPIAPDRKISRQHLVEEIHRALQADIKIVMLSGDALTGKSQIAADYFLHNPRCIGVFLGSQTEFFRSTDYVRLSVAEQIVWMLDREVLKLDVVEDAEYKRLIHRLQKHARREPVTWVLDGFQSNQGAGVPEEIIKLLPIEYTEFQFLVTGESDLTKSLSSKAQAVRLMAVPGVSPDEARGYLQDLPIEEPELQDMRSLCRSSIGRLHIVRRHVKDRAALEKVLKKLPEDSLDSIFDMEWQSIPHTPSLDEAMALVAYSYTPLTITEIATISRISPDELATQFHDNRLLSISDEEGRQNVAKASSRSSRKYLRLRLASLEVQIKTKLIDLLKEDPGSAHSAQYLAQYLNAANRNNELVECLDPAHFGRLLEVGKSLAALRADARMGFTAATKLGESAQSLGFALLSSVVSGLSFSVGTRYQVHAMVKIGNYDEAIQLAIVSPTDEERLRLLAGAAGAIKTSGGKVPVEIAEAIAVLVDSVDVALLGESGIETACDLLSVDGHLAYSLMQQVVAASRRHEQPALALSKTHEGSTLEIAVLHRSSPGDDVKLRPIDNYRLRKFWSTAIQLMGRLSAEELRRRIDRSDGTYSIFIITSWLSANRTHDAARDIANIALDLILGTLDKSPLLEDLRKISVVLPHVNGDDCREALCSRVETQYFALKAHGTTVDALRIRVALLRARYPAKREDVELGILELIYDIQDQTELTTEVICWVWLLDGLSKFKNGDLLAEAINAVSSVEQNLSSAIDKLLASVSNHYSSARDVVVALARSNPAQAVGLVARFNTMEARDKGYDVLARTLSMLPVLDEESIVKSISSIDDPFRRDGAIVDVMLAINNRGLPEAGHSISQSLMDIYKLSANCVSRIPPLIVSLCFAIQANDEQTVTALKKKIRDSWNEIPSESAQIDMGFWISAEVSKHDKSHAMEWLELSTQARRRPGIISTSLAESLSRIASLSSRLLPAVLKDGGREDGNFSRTADLIDLIPSIESRTRLWSSLGVRLYFSGNLVLAENVVEDKLVSLLSGVEENNMLTYQLLLLDAFPLIFLVAPATAARHLARVDSVKIRNSCLSRAIAVLMQRVPFDDPYNDKNKVYDLEIAELDKIVSLLKQVCHDGTIYNIVDELSRSIALSTKSRVRNNVRLNYLLELENIVARSLPDPNNVKHEGFAIAAKAVVLHARVAVTRQGPAKHYAEWDTLFKLARQISNSADRAITTAIVCVNAKFPSGHAGLSWQSIIKDDLSQIPSPLDRAGRYKWIAELLEGRDRVAAGALVREAVVASRLISSTSDSHTMQRKILDYAHSLDPALSRELVTSLDGDPARVDHLKQRDHANEAAKSMAGKVDSSDLSSLGDKQLVDICNRNLGGLNSGRVGSRPIAEFAPLIRRGQEMSP